MADLTPTVRLFGDKVGARELAGFAMQQLEITKNLMSFQELKQYKRRTTLPGGSVILCKVTFGQSVVDIFVPPVPLPPNEEIERFSTANLMPFWYKSTAPQAQQAHTITAYSKWKDKPPYHAKISAKPKLYTGPDFTIPVSYPFAGEHPNSGNALIGHTESYTWRVLPKPEDQDEGFSISIFKWDFFKIFEGHLLYFGSGTGNYISLRRSEVMVARGNVGNKTGLFSDGCLASNFYIYKDGTFDVFGLREEKDTFTRYLSFYIKRYDREGALIESINAYGQVNGGDYQVNGFTIAFDGVTYYTDFPLTSSYKITNWGGHQPRTIESKTNYVFGYDPTKRVMVQRQMPQYIDQTKGLVFSPSGSPSYGSYPNCVKLYVGGSATIGFRHSLTSGRMLEWSRYLSGEPVFFREYYQGVAEFPNYYCDYDGDRLARTVAPAIGTSASTLTETRSGEVALLNRKAVSFYDWDQKRWVILDEVLLYNETRATRLASGNWWECPGGWVVDFSRVETYRLYDGTTGDIVYEYVGSTQTWTSSAENYYACGNEGDLAFYENWADIAPVYGGVIPSSKRISCLRDLRQASSFGAYFHDSRLNDHVLFRQDYRDSLDIPEPQISASISIPQGGKQSLSLPAKEWRLLANSSLLGVGA